MVLAIERQPGTNTIEVVDNIQRLLPTFRKEIPQSIHLDTLYDASISIRDSVDDVKFTLYLTLALVVMVIFLFLRNISAPSFQPGAAHVNYGHLLGNVPAGIHDRQSLLDGAGCWPWASSWTTPS